TIGLADGVERWISATGHSFFSDRVAVRFVGTVLDITPQKRIDALLRASESQFRTMAQAMPNHVWTAQPYGRLDWDSGRVLGYTGADADSLRGSGLSGVVHPDDVTKARRRWVEAIASGTAYESELRLRRADGQWRWHLARAAAIRDADGRVTRWVGTNTDI